MFGLAMMTVVAVAAVWGLLISFVMMLIQHSGYWWVNLAIIVTILVLSFIVSFVYWSIDLLKIRRRFRLGLEKAERLHDDGEISALQKLLEEETWNNVLRMSVTVPIAIVAHSLFLPLIVFDIYDLLVEIVKKKIGKFLTQET